jgi:hypothetical protein
VCSIIRVYGVVYSVAWDFKIRSLHKVCFVYESNIDFVHVEKCLKLQFVVGQTIGVPEDYTQEGWP